MLFRSTDAIVCTFGELRDGAIFSGDYDDAPECWMKVGKKAVGFNEAAGKRIAIPWNWVRVRTSSKPVIMWYSKTFAAREFFDLAKIARANKFLDIE